MQSVALLREGVTYMRRGPRPKPSLAPINLPGREGKYEEGERLAPDPINPGPPVIVKVNVRESAIDHMASRGRLNASQVAAADWFRRKWELAAIGRQRGIDWTGGGGYSPGKVNDPLTDELVRAGRDLAEAMRALGQVRASIVISIVGEGKLIEEVANKWARAGGIVSGRRAGGYITGTLIDGIDDLVHLWRLEARGAPKKDEASYHRNGEEIVVRDAIRGSGPMSLTGPAREISIGKLGDVSVEERRGIDKGTLTVHTSGNLGGSGRRK